jgi:hypothetical protein
MSWYLVQNVNIPKKAKPKNFIEYLKSYFNGYDKSDLFVNAARRKDIPGLLDARGVKDYDLNLAVTLHVEEAGRLERDLSDTNTPSIRSDMVLCDKRLRGIVIEKSALKDIVEQAE